MHAGGDTGERTAQRDCTRSEIKRERKRERGARANPNNGEKNISQQQVKNIGLDLIDDEFNRVDTKRPAPTSGISTSLVVCTTARMTLM